MSDEILSRGFLSKKKRVLPYNQHAVEENIDQKITAMSGQIDLLGKILSVYGNDEKKIPGIFRQGFVDLRKQVESSYNEIIRET